MPISAVVVTLSSQPESREAALSILRADPRLTLGALQRNQLPVVVDTEKIADGVLIVREELPSIDGVEFVHVVSVDFSDVEDFDEKLPPRRRSRT
ncbi:hypothetical protein [Bradymonas sediminis]|uniref:Uncharacterized protein n=1 Tax=Bradymonas sediminis TaxID=1548548 RepID=A0A2Z4FMA8_9DELT|nr:hypothetical protein [Bradymonas sediminis]AWV89970.1 hypothetical protein DN745_11735 [Bradymonas sediminis]TDP76076.1 hypothetical protein DFR33_103427 [Bradymonas sediminis]